MMKMRKMKKKRRFLKVMMTKRMNPQIIKIN